MVNIGVHSPIRQVFLIIELEATKMDLETSFNSPINVCIFRALGPGYLLHRQSGIIVQDKRAQMGVKTGQLGLRICRCVSFCVICSSQFAENVSPRSNRLVCGAPPSMNEPVRSVLHELTGANCAQTKVTITLIAK